MRRTNDDRVARDDGRGVEADVGGREVDLLVQAQLEVDDAVVAEAWHLAARRGIERDHAVAGGDVDDPLRLAVGSIRKPPP